MANTYLSISSSTPTNSKKFTYSFWVKRTTLGADQAMLSYETNSANRGGIELQTGDQFRYFERVSNSTTVFVEPSRVFRDPSAWYHIVVATDTTQSTEADRVKIYVNGVQETDFATTPTYPALNSDTRANGSTAKNIGRRNVNNDYYFDGVMSHIHFTDGYAYTPSAFGETDSTTGEWKINTAPSVSYGNNGFFILKDGNSVTDQSGNSNNFSVGGGNLTKTEDAPSNVFATLNALNVPTSNAPTFSNGNTKTITMNTDPGYFGGTTTLGASSGKYYAEIKITDNNGVGAVGITFDPAEKARQGTTFSAQISDSFVYANNAKQYSSATGTSGSSYGNTYTDGDIIGIAMDLDNSKLYFSKNGTFQNSGDPTSGSTGTGAISITAGKTYFFYLTDVGGALATYECNFGNGYFGTTAVSSAGTNASNLGIFEYNVPNGFRGLCTKALNL